MSTRYQMIKQAIVEQIETGQLKSGDGVGSENLLADQYGVSRMTARRALTELVEAGVLQRSQGTGTFVAEQLPSGSLLEIRSIDEEILERGHQHSAEIISLAEVKADSQTAKAMGITVGSKLFYSEILHRETNHEGIALPLQLECRYVNPAMAPEYLAQDFQAITPSAYLSQVSPLNKAEHWVEAIMPNSDIRQRLGLNDQTPCLKLTRTTFSQWHNGVRGEQQTVTHATLYYPGDRYRLGGQLNSD